MDSTQVQQQLLKAKEERLQLMMKQYESLSAQVSRELSDANKVMFEQQIQQLEEQINQLTKEIDDQRMAVKPDEKVYTAYHGHWESNLPHIDFKKSKTILDHVLGKLSKHQDNAALFLLQNSASMEGDLCIKHLTARLQAMGTLQDPCIAEFVSRQVPDQHEFLCKVASRFQVQAVKGDGLQQYTQSMLDKIGSSLCSGDILLLQVGIYRLDAQNQFLAWFVDDFWRILVKQKLAERSHDHPFIKVVGVITIGNLVAKSCIPSDLYCTKQSFDGGKILDLPLQKWTEADIRNWLFQFSRLTEPRIGIPKAQIEAMAEAIHQVTGGTPSQARSELMKEMANCVG